MTAHQKLPLWPSLTCPDCGEQLHLQRKPEQWRGPSPWAYLCENRPTCRGLMSAHPDGAPCGIPANAETRRARNLLHGVFDPIWKNAPACYEIQERDREGRERALWRIRRAARVRLYRWLAAQLGIDEDDCHISLFDLRRCRDAWIALKSLRRKDPHRPYKAVREWAKARNTKEQSCHAEAH